ncbi:MAG TPA: transcription termination/antitermination protein NusA, partial [Bacteroidales bacterium]|nr:transcription termination/antitermination protein NusA [Bacteroidales bacterium]
FLEFKEVKNIDRPTLMSILKDVFVTAIAKQFGSSDNFDIIVNVDKGDLEIWRNRIVVANKDFKDKITEIPLSEARKIDSDYEIGEEVSEELELSDFERRTILTIRQTLAQRIADIEKNEIYYKFQNRVGELIIGEVHQVWKKEILILDGDGHELILPKQEQIPGDHYRKGDTIRAVIIKVEIKGSRPLILLSRTSSVFLERLFELEVPEIFDGLITIKKIVRVHGERAKVAVESYDDRIDPVGACVGMKGSRIHSIVRELRNENIDVINYTTNPKLYITRALSPAKINNIKINEENKHADVTLSADQVSLAIGKGGFNIKLASQLTGYEIDVYRDGEDIEEDVSLDEFSDEIDTWIIDQLKSIGCDTAKSVLRLSPEDLEKRTDLEEETIQEVIEILKSEFE